MTCRPPCPPDSRVKTGRGCAIDATLLFLFSSCLAGLPHFFHVIRGQDPKPVRPLTGAATGVVSWPSRMRVSSCPREAGVWRRTVEGSAANVASRISNPLLRTKHHGAGSPANLPLNPAPLGELSATSCWGRPPAAAYLVQYGVWGWMDVVRRRAYAWWPSSLLHVILHRVRASRNFGGELESRVAEPALMGAFRWPRRGDAPDVHPGANHADAPAAARENRKLAWITVPRDTRVTRRRTMSQ